MTEQTEITESTEAPIFLFRPFSYFRLFRYLLFDFFGCGFAAPCSPWLNLYLHKTDVRSTEENMFKLTIAILALALLTVVAVAQSAKRSGKTIKTIRLHIDGFTKSKSGAV